MLLDWKRRTAWLRWQLQTFLAPLTNQDKEGLTMVLQIDTIMLPPAPPFVPVVDVGKAQ
jgi:hypothetical protein